MIDRGSIRNWQEHGRLDTFSRARVRTSEILASYQRPELPEQQIAELQSMVGKLAAEAGMAKLPDVS